MGTSTVTFADAIGTNVKALAPLGSGRLLDAALDAAAACVPARLVVVGEEAVAAHCGSRVDDVLPAARDGRTNLERALRAARGDEALLLLTSDLPFITAAALRDFLARVGEADVAMPLATERAYCAAYPQAPAHGTRLGGERIVNGSVFYFAAGAPLRALAIAQQLFAARKSLVKMALLLEAPLVARFVLRRLRVVDVEAFATRKFRLQARAVRDASPALCYDIDSLADYRYALAHLDAR